LSLPPRKDPEFDEDCLYRVSREGGRSGRIEPDGTVDTSIFSGVSGDRGRDKEGEDREGEGTEEVHDVSPAIDVL
jgi:hypothetical protein